MDITAIIVAISGLIAGLIAGVIGWNNSRHIIKRDELTEIRKEVSRLQDRVESLEEENDGWRVRYNQLYEYVMVLRGMMITGKMDVPEMPRFVERKRKSRKKTEEE